MPQAEMAKTSQTKITLSQSRDIPFNKLVLSQANVRRIKAGVSIEELAEDIARRTLLQSLTVRTVLDDDGAEIERFTTDRRLANLLPVKSCRQSTPQIRGLKTRPASCSRPRAVSPPRQAPSVAA
jgi:hypothetical protein